MDTEDGIKWKRSWINRTSKQTQTTSRSLGKATSLKAASGAVVCGTGGTNWQHAPGMPQSTQWASGHCSRQVTWGRLGWLQFSVTRDGQRANSGECESKLTVWRTPSRRGCSFGTPGNQLRKNSRSANCMKWGQVNKLARRVVFWVLWTTVITTDYLWEM